MDLPKFTLFCFLYKPLVSSEVWLSPKLLSLCYIKTHFLLSEIIGLNGMSLQTDSAHKPGTETEDSHKNLQGAPSVILSQMSR